MWPFRMVMETIERVVVPLMGHLFPSRRPGRSLFEMPEEYGLDADMDIRPRTSRSTFDADDEENVLVEAHTN
jgi:hypothetical protein